MSYDPITRIRSVFFSMAAGDLHETFIAKLEKSKVRLFEKFLLSFWIRYSFIRTFTLREKYRFVEEIIVKFNDFVLTKSR